MGSSGSGSFGTYRIGGESGVSGGELIGGVSGPGEVGCPKVIENIRLEDVATSEYYVKYHALPSVRSIVNLRDKVYLGRLVVETSDTQVIIGNLPTQYNYLLNCLKDGLNYTGTVISSGDSPIPFVVVTLSA